MRRRKGRTRSDRHFIYSTRLEMSENKENSKQIKSTPRGATKHCCYGVCNSDSRYADRSHMENIQWIPFPKPKRQQEKCMRWVRACGREDFSVEKVRKWTYICSKHFVGGNGPTEKHPDPIPATYTPQQAERFSRKRKAPTPRFQPVSKKQLFDVSEALLSLQNSPVMEQNCPEELADVTDALLSLQNMQSDNPIPNHASTAHDPKSTEKTETSRDSGTQTTFACSEVVAGRIDKIIHQNEFKAGVPNTKTRKYLYKTLVKNKKLFKFYTGLSVENFNHLFQCLGECVNHLIYWKGNKTRKSNLKNNRKARKLTAQDELLLTLMKLRHAFPNRDLAFRFGISLSSVSEIVNTWIQFLYKQTECIREKMFPSKELIKKYLPPQFRSFKNVRVIIDCFEIFVESSSDFEEQGNLYSSYKNHSTLKCLVGISPTGAITFLSDTYEGSISDKEIFIKSGLLNLLEPQDLVIADRGFLIREVLLENQIKLNIPPFLKNRDKLTAEEEILTKRIARVRIHVERAIERMKNFKILGLKLPLSLKAVASQIVHIIGFLVNYQEPLVK